MKNNDLHLQILTELEEFHHENIPALMNTLLPTERGPECVKAVQSTLTMLVRAGHVTVEPAEQRAVGATDVALQDALQALDNLQNVVYLNPKRQLWTDHRHVGPPFQDVMDEVRLTPSGREAAAAILNERGYRWWEQRNDDEPGQ